MLRHWLMNPSLEGLVSDENILKHGEYIVDCERTLATVMQSSNIRLPGQRYCQFVSLEALKDIEQLKTLLCARIVDFLHAIFLIPPESLTLFEWCSADHFLVCLLPKLIKKIMKHFSLLRVTKQMLWLKKFLASVNLEIKNIC